MDESCTDEPKVFQGLYADLYANDYTIVREKSLRPDENTILFDFSKIEDETFRIIGTASRISRFDLTEDGFTAGHKTASNILSFTRVRLPKQVTKLSAVDEAGEEVPMEFSWDADTRTLLYSYPSTGKAITVTATY